MSYANTSRRSVLTGLILSAALMTPSAAQDDLLPDTQPAATTVEQALTPQGPAVANGTPSAPTPQASMSSAAVSVDAYRRNYEGPKDSRELSYDSGLLSALRSKESQIGNMEGSWVVAGVDGALM